jgi:hypothetical protein
MIRVFGAALALVFSLAFVGCGSPGVPTISFSPDGAAREAMALYDTNKDGKLDAGELKKCTALAVALSELDKNGDKCIDADEIAARISFYATSGTSLRGERAFVVRSGRPINGVTVTLEPEPFMLGAIKPAMAVSDESGDVKLRTQDMPYDGVQIGFFKITASQKDANGKELLPAKFNSATTLGVEIGPHNRVNLVIDLDK